jgi:two-component system response regulator DesR
MITIMIVAELDLVRGALAAVLAHEDDFEVTCELSLREDVMAAIRLRRPGVVVIDIDRYGADGAGIAVRLTCAEPDCRVLVLTGQRSSATLRDLLAAGVWGLMSADTSPEEVARSIRLIAAGERVIDPLLGAAALRADDNPLTGREQAVLQLAADGIPAKEIAAQLFLSPGTVRNYLSAAMHKTGARTRLEAVRRARDAGWLDRAD